MKNEKTPVAVEGVPFIVVGLLLSVVCLTLAWHIPAVFFIVLTLFTVFFFRNPERLVPAENCAVIAPADGVVIYLGPAVEEHTKQEMTKISIFMSVFNVHINRAPITGKVVDAFYCPGKFLDVRHERATFENERRGLVFETADAVRLVVVQVAGLIARRIVCYPKVGDTVQQGQRYGLIRFGSRLDVYLPVGATVRVANGEKTVAGETILGYLP